MKTIHVVCAWRIYILVYTNIRLHVYIYLLWDLWLFLWADLLHVLLFTILLFCLRVTLVCRYDILCRPLFWSMDYVELNRTFDQWYGRKSCVLRSALFTCTVLSLSHDLLVPVNRSNVSDEVESAKQDVYRRQALVRQAS